MYISKKFRNKFFKLYYAKPKNKYFDKQKIRKDLATRYYFPKLRREITDFIAKYDLYRRIKHERYRPYEEFRSPRVSINIQNLVVINQIIKLLTFKDPISKNSYDSIFVIINRLISYGIFLPYRENSNTE